MFGHQDEDQNQASDDQVAVAPQAANDDSNNGTNQTTDDDNGGYLDHITNEPLGDDQQETNNSGNASEPSNDNHDNNGAGLASDELLDIKKQALGELSPLVDHLDQSPEEKFKTTMMMIQAADNQSLIPEAYKAAKNIADEKARAQALLDIVNEINYFTHPHDN